MYDVRHMFVNKKKNAYQTTKKYVLYDMKTFLPSPGVYVVQLSSGRSEKTSSVTPLFYLTHGVITLRRNGLASFRNFSRFVISIFHFKFISRVSLDLLVERGAIIPLPEDLHSL